MSFEIFTVYHKYVREFWVFSAADSFRARHQQKRGSQDIGLSQAKGNGGYHMTSEAFQNASSAVCRAFQVVPDEIASSKRYKEYVEARVALAYILRTKEVYALNKIGRLMRKDHTTVMHYLKCAEDWCTTDRAFQAKLHRAIALYDAIQSVDKGE